MLYLIALRKENLKIAKLSYSMYIPGYFRIKEEEKILSFVKANNFGIISTYDHESDQIFSTHLPFIIEKNDSIHLYAHFAKANNHWSVIEKHPKVQVIFSGPHAYISPTFYKSPFQVPTWNYSAVHMNGTALIKKTEDSTKDSKMIMNKLVSYHENDKYKTFWSFEDNFEHIKKMMNAIIIIDIVVTSVDAVFKLSQNKNIEDQKGVINNLELNQENENLVNLMKQELQLK